MDAQNGLGISHSLATVQASVASLLSGEQTLGYGYPYAGSSQDKLAWADAQRSQMGLVENLAWTRDRSVDEQTYLDAKSSLRIGEQQQGLANLGDPAIYFLTGSIGSTIRAVAATNGALQFTQGAKQAVDGDGWNAAGNMVAGLLGMATLGIPAIKGGAGPVVVADSKVAGGTKETGAGKAPYSSTVSADAEAGMPYTHPVKEAGAKGTVNTALKLGETQTINDISMTRVGRWMSPDELAQMQSSNKIVQGGGGQTFISTNGAADFKGAASKGSVYVEFDVPSSGLLQGGKEGWYKMIGPDASKSQQYLLNKQGGEHLPEVKNITVLGSVRKALILGDAALKTASECSFTIRKLRFLGCFRLT